MMAVRRVWGWPMALIDDLVGELGPERSTQSVSPAITPEAGTSLHIHLAAMAPQFLDVRTSMPLRELGKAPLTSVSLSLQKIEVPRLPTAKPKILILQRIGVPELKTYKGVVQTLVERGWIVVAELDDHPDLLNAVHGRASSDAMWHPLRLAHAVQTSTPALAAAFRPHNPKVATFANAAFRLGPVPGRRDRSNVLRVFFGALNRERFSARIGASLSALAARRRDIQFVVVHDRAFFDGLGPASTEFHPSLPYENYLSLMESCDIALMPLEGGTGERYKSDVKFVEASSLGLATLASPVVYADTILDGVTGTIVPDIEGWSGALESLVSDPHRLLRISTAAHDYVGRHRLFYAQVANRLAWYRHLWDERIALTRSLSGRFGAA
jgi:hypothetical protein